MKQGRMLMALAAGLLVAADGPGRDEARLQGNWAWASAEFNGRRAPREDYADYRRVFRGDQWINLAGGQPQQSGTYRLDPTRSPKAIDLTYADGQVYRGIYKLEGDHLKTCIAVPGQERPTRFVSKPDSGWGLTVYRRARP